MSKKDYDKKIIELRDYLESFVKRYQNQSLHLIDITRHLNIISSYEEELEIIAERINNAKTCALKDVDEIAQSNNKNLDSDDLHIKKIAQKDKGDEK